MDIRWRCIRGKTLAWWLFKGHHTHLNDIYWHHKAVSSFAFGSTRSQTRTDATESVFPYAKGNRRIAPTLGQWAVHYDDFERWTNNAAILAIAGYLETYIAQVVTAAIESCPAVLIGGSKELDGVAQLKRQDAYDFYSHAEPTVRGNWQSRTSAYKRLFRTCPFDAKVSELEKLRKLRNNSGHAFGRDIDMMRFAHRTTVTRLPAIGEEALQRYLALAEEVAETIEQHLGKEFVGGYEVVKILHLWITKAPGKWMGRKDKGRAFAKHLATLTPHSDLGRDALLKLIDYYQSV
jgi:hypothetical protein